MIASRRSAVDARRPALLERQVQVEEHEDSGPYSTPHEQLAPQGDMMAGGTRSKGYDARPNHLSRTLEVVDVIAKQLPIEPPSWPRAWLDAGRLLPAVFSDQGDVGLSRLQNDCLWGLTARRTGALFVTADRHFEAIRRRLPFPLKILQA